MDNSDDDAAALISRLEALSDSGALSDNRTVPPAVPAAETLILPLPSSALTPETPSTVSSDTPPVEVIAMSPEVEFFAARSETLTFTALDAPMPVPAVSARLVAISVLAAAALSIAPAVFR